MILTGLEDMDLEQTLDCGQCFRFEPTPDGGWRGVAGGRAAVLHRREDGLHILPGDDFWRDYLDADRDYAAIRREFERDEMLRPCVAYAPGIRVLRQPAWEALVAFIVSQNNNVPRIKGILARLCRNFGEPVGWDYGFPSPERLAEQSEEGAGPSALRLAGRLPAGCGAKGGLRRAAAGADRGAAPAGSAAGAADRPRRGPQGGGMRAAVRHGQAGGLSIGRVDEAGHGGAVPRAAAGGFRALRGHSPTVYFSLLPPPSRPGAGGMSGCGQFTQESEKSYCQIFNVPSFTFILDIVYYR